ncbi:MAG: lycopene cyclase domain-containing protein [Cyclobacteriaceae bacterium]|nr:lycopene cyclase domain-containing protein [Cyclobacteriaceae bacterium]
MNLKYLYLFIDLGAISLPFLFSFHPKANFSKKWRYLFPAIFFPAILFLVWDVWFTRMGVWGFNSDYLLGIYFFDLPMEEILFFICIPYACVFTYEAVGFFSKRDYLQPFTNVITGLLIVILSVLAFSNLDRWYTSVTFLSCALFLIYLHFMVKPKYLGKFYLSFLFILIPFVLVNGILTGTGIESPVVWYNDAENLGIRLGTIPVEDTIYGMMLILMNVTIFEALQSKYQGSTN